MNLVAIFSFIADNVISKGKERKWGLCFKSTIRFSFSTKCTCSSVKAIKKMTSKRENREPPHLLS